MRAGREYLKVNECEWVRHIPNLGCNLCDMLFKFYDLLCLVLRFYEYVQFIHPLLVGYIFILFIINNSDCYCIWNIACECFTFNLFLSNDLRPFWHKWLINCINYYVKHRVFILIQKRRLSASKFTIPVIAIVCIYYLFYLFA